MKMLIFNFLMIQNIHKKYFRRSLTRLNVNSLSYFILMVEVFGSVHLNAHILQYGWNFFKILFEHLIARGNKH